MTKELKEKAIDIKGKKYVLVSDRVLYFNSEYPSGSIQTKLIEDGDRVTFSAKVTPDCSKPERYFTGHSQATWGDGYINKTSATENAETSAVGRALALMGIGVIDSIASADEIKKTEIVKPYIQGQVVKTASDLEMRHCSKHNVDVPVMISKTGSKYAKHFVDGQTCWVNSEEESDAFKEKQEDYAADNMIF